MAKKNGGSTATASKEPTHQAAPVAPATEGNGGSPPPVYSRRYPTGNGETIEVAVFAREVDNGANSFTSYSTGCKRHFKVGDEWKENRFFPPAALPVVAVALNEAFLWISSERNG